jgi:hypothetical protein
MPGDRVRLFLFDHLRTERPLSDRTERALNMSIRRFSFGL